MPDISSVSFPSVIGAQPAMTPTPRKKKRKKISYKNVTLSRLPTKFEAKVLSLTEIPPRLNAARDKVLATDSPDVVQATMREIARYGAAEVGRELVRQGAPILVMQRVPVVDVRSLHATIATDRAKRFDLYRDDAARRVHRPGLSPQRQATLAAELVAKWTPSLLKRFATRAVNQAFALGRVTAIERLVRRRGPVNLAIYQDETGQFISPADAVSGGEAIVDYVYQSAVMDENTCVECEDVDGETMELGDDRQLELNPPYYKCEGGDACRCVQIAVLEDGTEIDVDEIDEDTIP